MPKNIQELLIRDASRVIFYLYALGMVAKVVVRWVLLSSSCIAHPGSEYSWYAPEPGVRTPESAKGKGRCFNLDWHGLVYGWYVRVEY